MAYEHLKEITDPIPVMNQSHLKPVGMTDLEVMQELMDALVMVRDIASGSDGRLDWVARQVVLTAIARGEVILGRQPDIDD